MLLHPLSFWRGNLRPQEGGIKPLALQERKQCRATLNPLQPSSCSPSCALGQKTTAASRHSLHPEAEPQSMIQACDCPGTVLVAVTPPPEAFTPSSFSCRGG